jgi:hypothetical protein
MSWEGWLANASQEKRQAYMFKNMTTLPMFVGSIVHDVVESIITDLRNGKEPPSVEAAQKVAVERLRKGWIDSTKKRWTKSAKQYTNLAEHYYQEEVSKERADAYKHKLLACIYAFYNCRLFKLMEKLGPDNWITIEEFQKFQLKDGEEVAVRIDCGFRYEGKVYLVDWKSGRVTPGTVEQLVTYAMYALKEGWAKKVEDIVIVPAYLFAWSDIGEEAIQRGAVTMKHVQRQAGTIRSEYPLLRQAYQNRDNQEHFPRTDDEKACRFCQFRGMCDGARTEVGEGETPF